MDEPLASMANKQTEESIEFPRTFTIAGNIALATWIAADAVAFLVFDLVTGVVFLLTALIAVYGILKFLGCLRPCFNCKKCTFGFGRLAALYFGERTLKDYQSTYHLPVALFFYVLIGPFPAAFAVLSMVQEISVLKTAVAILLLSICTFSALTWSKRFHY